MMSKGIRLLKICQGEQEEGGRPKAPSSTHYFEESYEILHA